jgi:hypothetical protein
MKGKMISRIGAALLSCAVIATSLPSTAVVKAVSGPGFNYGEALRDTIIFMTPTNAARTPEKTISLIGAGRVIRQTAPMSGLTLPAAITTAATM